MRRQDPMRAWESMTWKGPRTTLIIAGMIWVILTAVLWLAQFSGLWGSTAEFLTLCAMVLLGAFTVIVLTWGTLTKNRWGINTGIVICPRCETKLPAIRKPTTLQQFLWGGGMCPTCGTEVDKWGREVAAPSGVQSDPKKVL